MWGWIAETTLVAGVLAGVAALSGRFRTVSPTARHLLWLVVLIKLLTPPVVSSPWPLEWPSWFSAGAAEEPILPIVAATEPAAPAEPIINRVMPDSATLINLEFQARERPGPVLTSMPDVGTASADLAVAPGAVTTRWTRSWFRSWSWLPVVPDGHTLQRWALACWLVVTLGLLLARSWRILRFRRVVRQGVPAPNWLVDEAERIGMRLGVRVPEVLAVPGLGTPLLWCLGRPRLLLPVRLVKSLDADRWRGILAHELAHLRRGDHWVSRLELAAGLIWWWNPLYWLTRRRLDAEAELACDAWVVWALPDDRLTYAEVLFQICAELSLSRPPAPALGVAGAGRFFERRLSMILRDQVSCRISPLILLAACCLVLLALPTWTSATPAALIGTEGKSADSRPSGPALADADDDDDSADADDDAADKDKPARPPRHKAHRGHQEKAPKAKKSDKDIEIELDFGDFEKQIESAFGPEFEKQMEALGEQMEKKFGEGSEFARKMEALGKEMEKKFGEGSEFAKKMEALGKEMEKKFGEGSEFEKRLKEKLGPGSEFEKKMKSLGEEMEKKLGPGSEFEKKLKEKAAKGEKKAKEARAKDRDHESSRPRARERDRKREQRVKALEARIKELTEELKALQSDDPDDDGGQDQGRSEDEA